MQKACFSFEIPNENGQSTHVCSIPGLKSVLKGTDPTLEVVQSWVQSRDPRCMLFVVCVAVAGFFFSLGGRETAFAHTPH